MSSSSSVKEEIVEEEEPLSPYSRGFHSKKLNCWIITIIGWKTSVDVGVVKMGLENTLIKHPRFSSLLVKEDKKGGGMKWRRTKANVDNHVINPNLNPNMDSPDQFVEDYISNLTKTPMNPDKPLWEFHILNLKTSDAGSIGILKVHHSVGDGMSLISLFLASTRKTSDPDSLPTIPRKTRPSSRRSAGFFGWFWWLLAASWWLVVGVMYTLVDVVLFAATMLFLKDQNPIKSREGADFSTRMVHRVLNLDDVKLVKNAMNTTINDVVLGVTQAGLSRYLNRRCARDDEKDEGEIKKTSSFFQSIRLRAVLIVNVRPSTGIEALADMMEKGSKIRWGNKLGYVIIPFNISSQDEPLDYIHQAKAIVDRKKLSFEALFSFLFNEFMVKLFGVKMAVAIAYKVAINTTLCFSNVVGPQEEISFYGHPISYIAPSVYGQPQALMIHWQSCGTKMTVSLGVDQDVIPDPHQLCNDIEESLQLIKDTLIQKGHIEKVA